MLTAVTEWVERLITRAELTVRAVLRALADRRIDRLYGNLPAQTVAARRDAQSQAATLAGIVRFNCDRGTTAIEAHATAAIKLDSAEYMLSMMLEELRDVMPAPPSTWTPERVAFLPDPTPVAESIARAA